MNSIPVVHHWLGLRERIIYSGLMNYHVTVFVRVSFFFLVLA
jgi:hypothetical protein